MPEVNASSPGAGWKQVLLRVAKSPNRELSNVILNIQDEGSFSSEELEVQNDASDALQRSGKQRLETVANTIFPLSLWSPALPRQCLFERYLRLWPRISQYRKNNRGTYFHRLISYPSPTGVGFNQLEHVIAAYAAGIRRRSTFQCGILAPWTDLRATPFQGFPCMQQVAFIPERAERLRVVALYPMHYLWERAYGNYLGLVHLGRFMANEMGLTLSTVTCISLVAKIEDYEPTLPFIQEAPK